MAQGNQKRNPAFIFQWICTSMGKIIEHLLRNWKFPSWRVHTQVKRRVINSSRTRTFSTQKPDLSFRQLLVSPKKRQKREHTKKFFLGTPRAKVWGCNFCSSKTFKSVELATKLINEFAFDDVATAMKRAIVVELVDPSWALFFFKKKRV